MSDTEKDQFRYKKKSCSAYRKYLWILRARNGGLKSGKMSSFLQGRAHTTHRFQVTQTEATAHNKSSISSEEEPSRVKIRRGVKNSSESTSVRSQHKRNVMLRRRLRPAANGFLFLFLFISPSFFPSKYSCHKTHNNCNYADLLHLLRMGWF